MKRNLTLDIMKLALSLFVVAAHAGFGKGISFGFRYLLYNGLFRIAVPMFFVVNGYFFYRNVIAGKVEFKTWRNRLIVLYLIWAFIYLPRYWPHTEKIHIFILQLGGSLMFGWLHLWYLVSTLGAGIIIFYYLKNKSSRYMIFFSGVIYAIGLYLQYAGNYHWIQNETVYTILEDTAVYRNFLFFGLPFLSIGYLLAKHEVVNRVRANTWLILGAVLSVLLVIVEAAMNLHFLGSSKGFDMMFTIPLVGPMLFLAAQKFPIPASTHVVSDLSTGVYLIHPFFIFLLIALGLKSSTLITLYACALALSASWLLLKFETARRLLF